MSPSEIYDALHTVMGDVAAVALIGAGYKMFVGATKFGRLLERSEANEKHIEKIPKLVGLIESLQSMVGQLAGNHTELKGGLEKLDSDFQQLRSDVSRHDGSLEVMLRESSSHGGDGYR